MSAPHFTIGIACLFAFLPGCPWDCLTQDANECWEDNEDNDDETDEEPQLCGDGVVDEGEACDDGNATPGDGCSDACTIEPCTWDVDQLAFPLNVRPGQAVLGEIEFDGDCNLIVGGGEELPYSEGLYRVADDGTVSVLVDSADLPTDSLLISAITHHPGDDRIYFVVGVADANHELYAVDDLGVLQPILSLADPINSLTVAPAGSGFGGDLIGVQYSPNALVAIDVAAQTVTTIATSTQPLSVVTFSPDGTLYVAEYGEGRISTVAPDGTFSTVVAGLYRPDGLAVSPDGTRMFVASVDGYLGRIDEFSLPGALLTPRISFEIGTGFAPTGIVVDGDNNVLYEMPHQDHAAIGMFSSP